jgi:hypothetical protein
LLTTHGMEPCAAAAVDGTLRFVRSRPHQALGFPLEPMMRLVEGSGPDLAAMLRGLVRKRQISGSPVPADAVAVANQLDPQP